MDEETVTVSQVLDRIPIGRFHRRLLAITGSGPIQTVSMVTRESETQFRTDSLFETRTGYLIGAEPQPAFSL